MSSIRSTLYVSVYILYLSLSVRQATSFQGSYHQLVTRHCSSTSLQSSSDDIFANETPEEREERMKLVRRIQGAFYQQTATEDQDEIPDTSNGILPNLALFRVQWTELPGYQNILNIHVPHYTHMFRTILAGPKPWRFGSI